MGAGSGGGGGGGKGGTGGTKNSTSTCWSLSTTWTICDIMNSIELSIALRAVKKN